ncbi:polysaccharide biosynthesis C-terminal domain-containing protein [candidate division KSB1 bacterium]
MANVRLVAKNSTYLITENLITRAIDFIVLIILLNQYLPIEKFGFYNWVISYLNMFAIFVDLGMNGILQREIARDDSLSVNYMGTSLTFSALMSVILLILSGIFYAVFYKSFGFSVETVKILIFATPYIIFSSKIKSYRKLVDVMYIVRYKILYIVIFNILGRLILLIWVWMIIVNNGTLFQIIIAMTFSDFPGFLCIFLLYFRLFPKPKFGINKKLLISLLKKSYPLFFGAMFLVINLRISILIIPYFMTPKDISIFRISSMVPEILTFFPMAILIPLGPILSKKYIENKDAFFDVYSFIVKFLAFISIPIVLIFFSHMEGVIRVLTIAKKMEFVGSVLPGKIIIFSQFFVFISTVFYYSLVTSDKQKYQLIVQVCSGILNIILNIILIPIHGIVGASIAIVVSYGIFLPIGLLIKETRKLCVIILKVLPKPILASSAVLLSCIYFGEKFYLSIPVGILLYILLLIMMKAIKSRDKEIITELLGR